MLEDYIEIINSAEDRFIIRVNNDRTLQIWKMRMSTYLGTLSKSWFRILESFNQTDGFA